MHNYEECVQKKCSSYSIQLCLMFIGKHLYHKEGYLFTQEFIIRYITLIKNLHVEGLYNMLQKNHILSQNHIYIESGIFQYFFYRVGRAFTNVKYFFSALQTFISRNRRKD